MKEDTMKPFITVDDVSELLKLPVSSIYHLASGKTENPLPAVRIGRLLRFDPDAVRAWIAERTAAVTTFG
jgi:excisionase family DNA binding protein